MFDEVFKFKNPVEFRFGYGEFKKLGKYCQKIGTKFLLVTSPTKRFWTEEAVKMLEDAGKKVVHFPKILPNPTTDMVDEGVELAIKNKCDAVISIGGGSPIDAAKGIAVTAGNGGKAWDYQDPSKDTSKALPLIAVPTTSGTGTDGDRYYVLTNEKIRSKKGFATDNSYPAISILDPELTETMPERVTMDTAIDALGHSFEAYYAKLENPFSDMISLDAIGLIFDFLPLALKDPKDREARSALMLASAMGGIAIDNNGVCTPHGVAMALGGSYGITHGQGVGIVLPNAVEKAKNAAAAKFSFMARFFGWSNSDDIQKNADAVPDRLFGFLKDIGFYQRLSEIGIKKDYLDHICDKLTGADDIENDQGDYAGEEWRKFLDRII